MGHATDNPRHPSLTRNYISFAGFSIAAASLSSIVLLVLIELTGEHGTNPYLGILTYIILPSILGFGLIVIPTGMLLERRRRRRLSPDEIAAYPILDLNEPRRRRSVVALLGFMFLFIFMSAFGSYRAYEYTESVEFCGTLCHEVMKPEFVAYNASPHARVRCVECHVGEGPDWYVKSKLSGAYQLYSVTVEKFPRPIPTPVHNLRPAQDTCEKCHWPEKFWGTQLKQFTRYGYDEANTLRQTRMLINTGGGSPETGQVAGIHWHMNISNEITYAFSDDQRQTIPWVRLKDRNGNVTEYTLAGTSPQEFAGLPTRLMDCVDCHNRPTHIYQPPDRAVDDAITAGRLDAGLPYLKRQAVEALARNYASTEEALQAIRTGLPDFYRTRYPEVYATKRASIDMAAAEVSRIFETYFFPEMKTDWTTHPNNIGHFYSDGCFRCHDGKHVSATGAVIRNDCSICHSVLDQTVGAATMRPAEGAFTHPVDLGDLSGADCARCHTGDRPFQHPVNLGDISEFKCSECHPGGAGR